MTKSTILTILLTSLPLIAGVDREFVFDIHDAASSTEQYSNEALIIPVYQIANSDLLLSDDFAGILPDMHADLPALLKARAFDVKGTDTATFSAIEYDDSTVTIIASPLGANPCAPLPLESFRRCLARGLRAAEKLGIQTVHIALPTCIDGTIKQIAQEIATITHLTLCEYNALKSVKVPYGIKRVCVHAHMPTPNEFKDVNIGLRLGSNLGVALCQARDWINAPSNLMTPTILAANAAQFVQPYIAKIETIIFEKQDITRMGMGGLLAVSQGSDQPCAFVVHYLKAKRPHAPTIALVGKGLTFNAGGLNLKNSLAMQNMKTDMAGAAAVFTALNVFAYRNTPANIVVVAPLAENVINGSALKPGDVVKMFNGTTVEVLNTDAADRLMLADALAYTIKHYNPDYIIDIATLTQSCKQIFGGSYAAIMGNNDTLLQCAQKAAIRTGEAVWNMPLNDEYTARLQSDIADLSNVPEKHCTATTQTAGCFLQQFVGSTPWLHIDISGAKTAPEYTAHGNSLFGIRLLVDLIESLAQEIK
jgi:leucyl aminopeptidase